MVFQQKDSHFAIYIYIILQLKSCFLLNFMSIKFHIEHLNVKNMSYSKRVVFNHEESLHFSHA